VGVVVCLGGGLVGLPMATTACFSDVCKGDTAAFGEIPGDNKALVKLPGKGRYIDENTWESSPLFTTEQVRLAADGGYIEPSGWVPYTHKRFLELFTGDERFARDVDVYISVGERQGFGEVTDGVPRVENFTLASGNLAKILVVRPGIVTVVNDSCADFYARVVVHFPPRLTGTENDAGTDAKAEGEAGVADAGASDAATDSPVTD